MNDRDDTAEVTVIVVSFNTKALTLSALETLLQNAGDVRMRIVVWDNASSDGSADAIAGQFPQLELIRHPENVGFASANNAIAESVDTDWLLLLNSDTETHADAVANLLSFARSNPQGGIYGGRTVFADGSLNPTSCWQAMTPWSLVCSAIGLSRIFPDSALFNPEGMGGWRRDSTREVGIVTGCLFMIGTSLWRELGGFHPRYFMYGEESDMCLRAMALGYRPMITPDAQIMHLGGASSAKRSDKLIPLLRSKATLIRDHWNRALVPFGISMLWLWIAVRYFAHRAKNLGVRNADEQGNEFAAVWKQRKEWLKGY